MIVGFDAPLYILPFDHLGSFETNEDDSRGCRRRDCPTLPGIRGYLREGSTA
jgi:hypothetical protein